MLGTKNDVHVPITSAVYDPTSNSVLLSSARRLNVHYDVLFTINASVFGGANGNDFVTLFGGKKSLGGFLGEHHQHFFAVQNGHLAGMTDNSFWLTELKWQMTDVHDR